MPYFVDVVLPIPLERTFTYSLTAEEVVRIQIGTRIAVPFGKSKIYTAIVVKTHEVAPEVYEAKPIYQILDDTPLVTQTQLRHWIWIAQYYMCTLGEVVRMALPSALLLESETLILRKPDVEINDTELKDDEFLVYEALQHQSMLKVGEIAAIVDKKNVLPLVNRMVKKGLVTQKEALYEQYKPKWVSFIKLSEAYQEDAALEVLLDELTRAPQQSKAVLSLFQLQSESPKPIPLQQLLKTSNVSRGVVNSLVNKAVLEIYQVQMDRMGFKGAANSSGIQLNSHQQTALDAIQESFSENKVALLHGVTSSGKTEVYIKLLEQIIAKGQQALYLVPEIALTAQLVGRLRNHFGDKIMVYHSRYSVHERVEVRENVRKHTDKAQIIIGARSSLFLPFKSLGFIVIDEEHESSFKQFDPAPRYHARDAAIVLAALQGASCLLGSATPSIETMDNVHKGKYGYAEISQRYGNVLMPDISLVDLKEATKRKKMNGHFSERLIEAMNDALEEGEQIILFQNRRGFSQIVECTTCGHVPQCPNCDVSLTYHQYKNQLRCHYCGYHMAMQNQCRACGSATLDKKGFGTEQIEKECDTLFPKAKVGRMDLDTTRGKHAYEKIITAFEQQEIDILVGTQMVVKGLDFRNVSLVGVMNADTLLHYPDYRAHERTFHMLTQVSGRAGRTQTRGKVLIQTYNPFHQILQQVTTYDYEQMFQQQRYEREQFKYPPKLKIIKNTLKTKDFDLSNDASRWFAKALKNIPNIIVLGPEAPAIGRIRRDYLKTIMVKIGREQSMAQIKNSIKRIEQSFNAISQFKRVRLVYDVDHI